MKPYAELTTTEKGIEFLRWLLVLPVAIIAEIFGSYFVQALLRLVLQLYQLNPPSVDATIHRTVRYIIWLVPVGVIVIIAAARTAPRRQFATAVFIAVLWGLTTAWIHRWALPTNVATLLGVGTGITVWCYLERRNSRQVEPRLLATEPPT